VQILLVSDLHYSLKQLDWVVQRSRDFDLVVIAGDLLSISSAVEPDAQIAVVLEYLSRIAGNTIVAVCSGNHDLNARNDLGERAAIWLADARDAGVYTDGSSLVTDEVYVSVYPWWDGPRTREAVDAAFLDDAEAAGTRMWIWVYHAPPDGSPTSWTGTRNYGDADLNAWIEKYQPALVLCGHVHQSPFANGGAWDDHLGATVVVNCGQERGFVPPHIVIDTSSREISWSSSAGAERRSF
jgi:Icc-related predicted phosphoesterase